MKSSLFLRDRFSFQRFTQGLENPRYLLKWLMIASLIGSVAGLGAIAFYAAIQFATHLFLNGLVGYTPPSALGEGSATVMPFWNAAHPWLLPVVTALGGLISGIIVFKLAPEAEGHGTDAAIAAFHEDKAIRARIPLIKLVASAITIGSGGSAGREGPAAQISAGFGSLLATALKLDSKDRRIALATGMGAGIGAIFGAPLGGAILAAEILYKDDLEVETIMPALIASIVGYSIFGAWSGWHPIFSIPANLTFSSPPQLLYYIVLGVLCGFIGRLYSNGFYGLTHTFQRIKLPQWFKPALGGLLVGLIGLLIPQAIGMGYGWIQVSMDHAGLLSLPLWIIIALPFVKILTTGLTVGSGGSGGIFGPGMVIGGMVGALLWRISYHVLPGVPELPAPFVIVGMMALFGGIAHAPLAVMLMVAEMTDNLSLLAPAMIAVSISYILVGSTSIYQSQYKTRANSPAHRLEHSFPLLSTLTVRQAMTPITTYLTPDQSLSEAKTLLAQTAIHELPVINAQQQLSGILTLENIQQQSITPREQQTVATVMQSNPFTLQSKETLDNALEQLTTRHLYWTPVIENDLLNEHDRLIGILTTNSIINLYRATVASDTHHIQDIVQETVQHPSSPSIRKDGEPR
ncbi:chloride channel protein [Dictyobacter arantiisoli]|uniref:Chloride channel protein n=1 Tax=Dictyobacter arantiisoli TaxID=2014874 RepID=A0A5A5TAG3_9CHLR|nr:chloride channel protein [Dictyobacter arantiisoli]GCF08412.1 chloride channel protein [Dictyobacter arantiisoli]